MNEPKYLVIKRDLKKKIETDEYVLHSKIPSETVLRNHYDVSRHTVRQAISELVNEGYLVKQQGSGTFVDNAYKFKNRNTATKTIGVITTYLSDYIFPSIIRGIEEELSQVDYSLLLSSTRNNVEIEAKTLENMLLQDVDGLIIEPTKSNLLNPNLNYYLNLAEKSTPVVMINASYDELDMPVIGLDDIAAGRRATDYLIANGHSNIGIIIKSDDMQGKKRFKGYVQALYDARLSFSNAFIIRYDTENKYQLSGIFQSMLTKEGLPTAFVCYNDEVAVQFIKDMSKAGMTCPDDISIVSHDDSFYSTALPSVKLTTIRHPKERLGKKAAEVIIAAVAEGKEIEPYMYEPELVIRDSVKDLTAINLENE